MHAHEGVTEVLLGEVAGAMATTADDPPGAQEFVRHYYEHLPTDDTSRRDAGYLAAVASAHWRLAARRRPGESNVKVWSPTAEHDGFDAPHTLVQVVTDDMPFLVDSLTMEVARHGAGIHLVLHPQLAVVRDGERLVSLAAADEPGTVVESFILVEIDRETSVDALDALEHDLQRVLRDVRVANDDWAAMTAAMHAVITTLEDHPPVDVNDDVDETVAFLRWLVDDHFTFLGAREYDLVTADGHDTLQAVAGSGLGILRHAPESSRSFADLPPTVRRLARERTTLILTKANSRATVHRATYLDYVGVKRFGPDGEPNGEHRFLGLYTAAAYHESPRDIPLLRRKVAEVAARADFLPDSHDRRQLEVLLETYPRDELFQIRSEELYETAMGILQLQEQPRVRLFVRRDVYDRFVTCLVYVPRDRYRTEVRTRIADLLTHAFGAVGSEWSAMVTESVLARLEFTLHTDPDDHRDVDVGALEADIATITRSFADSLRDALVAAHGEEEGLRLLRSWAGAFPPTYREWVHARDAVSDIALVGRLLEHRIVARLDTSDGALLLTLAGREPAPLLSDLLPTLRNMGAAVLDEYPFTLDAPGGPVWLRRIGLRPVTHLDARAGPLARNFEDALLAALRGACEDDGFNRLVLGAGLAWREVAVLRACSRYLRQTGTPYSQTYIEDAVTAHPEIARDLLELFVARCAPDRPRDGAAEALRASIAARLDDVASLDEDRILRSLLGVILATLRTNWFLPDAPDGASPRALACKLDPAVLPELPEPRPMFEIFVYSPRMEGVHLRGGRVARGGIRWSDRREDFRTEILGLMKAQMVKNAVIVPVGAKGGFVLKAPPSEPEALRAEIAACYRTFIAALLDLTDDLVDGAAVGPPGVVRHDGDDPYLVVAADRGTATFSDMANAIALERGYWLGDAFASGGSAGFDHKEMGITARGAWESVRHHFRHLGIDLDTAEFTVVGIGDMSGDVFGNAMLLSPHLRLVAAFDHRHVFLDPDPDPAVAFAERRRLFGLPGSSWDDYDRSLVSAGGGVHPRSAKSVPVTPEVQALLQLPNDVTALTPNELIRAVLRAPVDLLFNGGIGTFVKGARERHTDVADKANDTVRVDASALRCRVVAEGGNLGLTQAARVELALRGVLVNTDAIDNSAGVDTSDHEVNIKILLDSAVRQGALTKDERDALLATMTEEVASLVLRDNYRQNRALANARAQAAAMLHVHSRYLRALETSGDLHRDLERLPDDEVLVSRRNAGIGLVGPELAVLMAYAKVGIARDLLESTLPDDPDVAGELVRYFPARLSTEHGQRFATHPLRREIVATGLANGLVNRAGVSFAFRMCEESGASPADVVRAHEIARAVFDQDGLWREIEGLDGVVAAAAQTDMYLESRKLVERACRWFLRKRQRPLAITATIEHFRNRVARVAAVLPDLLRGTEREWLESATADYAARGVPRALAGRVAALESLYTALDIVDIAELSGRDVEDVAALHTLVGDRLRLDWLRDRVVDLPRADRWQSLSRLALREDAYDAHAGAVVTILAGSARATDPEAALDAWVGAHRAAVDRVLGMLDDVGAHGVYDLATLSVALREVRNLLPQAG